MGSHSPSARRHRALVFLAQLVRYKTYGPLVGPKEAHQPDLRWTTQSAPCPWVTAGEQACHIDASSADEIHPECLRALCGNAPSRTSDSAGE